MKITAKKCTKIAYVLGVGCAAYSFLLLVTCEKRLVILSFIGFALAIFLSVCGGIISILDDKD